MPQYMLLLRDDPSEWGKLSPEDMQKAMERYMEWRQRPFCVGGKRLDSFSGKVMTTKDGKVTVTDGPFSESREVLGGYYTIEAGNYDAAVKLTMDHPHVEFGTVEVREVMSMPEGE